MTTALSCSWANAIAATWLESRLSGHLVCLLLTGYFLACCLIDSRYLANEVGTSVISARLQKCHQPHQRLCAFLGDASATEASEVSSKNVKVSCK